MSASPRPTRPWLLAAALVGPFLIPPVAFLAVALAAGLGPGEAWGAMVGQIRGRPALITPGFLSLLPMGLFLGVLALLRRRNRDDRWVGAVGWAGVIPSLLLLVWANLEVWPLYLPGRAFPGFPHGLELVIVPLFFVPVAMVVGGLVGAVVARSRS